jgi:ABC-type protease/lipase transport system fused ATPase/permease subunit
MDFVSVERVVELLYVEQEPSGTVSPPAWWPSYNGDIIFEDVTIRYAPHLDPALNAVSFKIRAGFNTAIIGRTGALPLSFYRCCSLSNVSAGSGKSTLALALLATSKSFTSPQALRPRIRLTS